MRHDLVPYTERVDGARSENNRSLLCPAHEGIVRRPISADRTLNLIPFTEPKLKVRNT